jgi:hypothetical protein
MLGACMGEGSALKGHLANHFESTGVRESGMLVGVHPAVFLKDWGFGDFQSLRTSPGGHPVQPIEASQLGRIQCVPLVKSKHPSTIALDVKKVALES